MKTLTDLFRGEMMAAIRASGVRALCLFIGTFSLVGALTSITSGFNPNIWWIDLRWLPAHVGTLGLVIFGTVTVSLAIFPECGSFRRVVALLCIMVFLAMSIRDTILFWVLLSTQQLITSSFVPFSLFAHLALWVIFISVWRPQYAPNQPLNPLVFVSVLSLLGILFPLFQVYCFGKTNYQRRSDTAVVFGARVYGNGQMSMALRDRIQRACELYAQEMVSRIIVSGGPGDGRTHETEAMYNFAIHAGVPEEAIWIDPNGLNTQATVENSLKMLHERREFGRIIAVSEFYHLPRIKLTFHACGREVYTVSPRPGDPARNHAYRSIFREIPAYWVYFARSVGSAVFT